MWRKTFSRTTIASSITRPTESDSASNVTRLIDRPKAWSAAKVAIMITGSPAMVTSVLRMSRKNTSTTSIAAIQATISSSIALRVESLIKVDWSLGTKYLRSFRPAKSFSSSALTPSATATVFAPDCLRTDSAIASLPSSRA
jgi:hypothetical protein